MNSADNRVTDRPECTRLTIRAGFKNVIREPGPAVKEISAGPSIPSPTAPIARCT